jgi:hypothetical protein
MKQPLVKRVLPIFLLTLGFHCQTAWSTDLPDAGCSNASLIGSYSWDETTRTDYSSFGFEEFGAGWVHAVSVGRETHDGLGNITSGAMTINNTFSPAETAVQTFTYTGTVDIKSNCVGTYTITLDNGESGGGGAIYIDPISKNFTLLDAFNIGTAKFVRDGSGGGLKSPFPSINWQ